MSPKNVLERLSQSDIDIPTPKTWILKIDQEPPSNLEFPLFVRTPKSSWKRGGDQAKARNLKELNDEVELLRRTFGWDDQAYSISFAVGSFNGHTAPSREAS